MRTSRELRELFSPQMEQLGVELVPCAGGWAGAASRPEAEGVAWVMPVGANCLVVEHAITPRADFTLEESSLTDYACLCLATEDTAADMPQMVEHSHPLLGGNVFSYLQPAGSITCRMDKGKTYASRSISFLPGYFEELARGRTGDYAEVFEAFGQPWRDDASREILACLRSLGPTTTARNARLQETRIKKLTAALEATCTERTRAQRGAGSTESARLAAEARAYVERNLAADLSIEAVACALYVGRTRLCAVFRAECGRGLAEYVRVRRMDVAADLLATTDLPVAEVARRVGYPRPSSFSTAFSQVHGTSPAAWRQRQQG